MIGAKQKKILVIDDEPEVVHLIRLRLEMNHYQVVMAYDGVEGIEKVKAEKPDLILLDILMPRMDGGTFLQEMKKQDLMGDIPIIVLTAKASMKEFFLVQGVVEFIVKPFEAKNLLAEIEKHLSLSSPSA